MKTRLLFFIFTAFLVSIASAQTPEQFVGKITGLQPDTVHMYQRVFSGAGMTPKVRFSPELESKAIVSSGKLIDDRTGNQVEILLVEPQQQMPYLAADLNADGTISSDERFAFKAGKDDGDVLHSTLFLPIKDPLFRSFPIYVRYFRGFKHPKLVETDRLVSQTVYALAYGDVTINGKSVLFQFPFVPSQQPSISTTEGLFGIDADGDGRIRNEQFSVETSYASEAEVVLRYGDIFLSTSSIDLAKNQIIVRRRDKSEYLRQELEVGKEMPDFSFTDFDGKPRKLSEFRGKYVLIDFWGVWCGDCIRGFPSLIEAYKKFHSRGFEILGLDWDDKLSDAAEFLTKNKATWTQARKDSIKTLTEVTYRIQEYPSAILLGPDGKVLVLDQHKLEGDELIDTLGSIIPK